MLKLFWQKAGWRRICFLNFVSLAFHNYGRTRVDNRREICWCGYLDMINCYVSSAFLENGLFFPPLHRYICERLFSWTPPALSHVLQK